MSSQTFFTILCYVFHDFYRTFLAVAYWAAILDAIMQVVAVPKVLVNSCMIHINGKFIEFYMFRSANILTYSHNAYILHLTAILDVILNICAQMF